MNCSKVGLLNHHYNNFILLKNINKLEGHLGQLKRIELTNPLFPIVVQVQNETINISVEQLKSMLYL